MTPRTDPTSSSLPPEAVQQSQPAGQPREVLRIERGSLGPVKPCEIEVGPLTVFIGQQGTGKSLVAQMLYFFRALPELVSYRVGTVTGTKASPQLLKGTLDNLRSRDRGFASMVGGSLGITWEGSLSHREDGLLPCTFGLEATRTTHQVAFSEATLGFTDHLVSKLHQAPGSWMYPNAAIFVPTERLFYSQFIDPVALRLLRTSVILERYASWMSAAGAALSDREGGGTSAGPGEWIREHLSGALAGEARMVDRSWKWEFHDGEETSLIDLDMASSGQRANWSLSLLPQVLLWWTQNPDPTTPIADPFTLYIEEPEIHLHPAAERAVVEVIAYLINQGFRVVLTTHSLTVLYTINNLLAASKLPAGTREERLPVPEIRLRPGQVRAYHLEQGGVVTPLLDPESGTIDESKLGRVSDALSAQMNRILTLAGG